MGFDDNRFENIINGQRRVTKTTLRKPRPHQEQQHEAEPEIVPEPPPELTGRALEMYVEFGPMLAGKIGYNDWPLIAAYCREMDVYWQSVATMNKKGLTTTAQSGWEQQSAYVGIAKQALQNAQSIGAQFGFSPLARKQITGPKNPKFRRK